ncbi:MAG: hypothetical protein ACRDWD_09650 [Acidimicrobiia bacterium]
MHIDKRWIVPGTLSVMLFTGLAFVITLGLTSPTDAATGPTVKRVAVTGVADEDTQSCVEKQARQQFLAGLAAASPEAAAGPVASDGSQINTRGFGDIGMQFQNVNIGAPITNVHISNQGNRNTTNTIIGDNNTINNNQPPPDAATEPSESPGTSPDTPLEPAPAPTYETG